MNHRRARLAVGGRLDSRDCNDVQTLPNLSDSSQSPTSRNEGGRVYLEARPAYGSYRPGLAMRNQGRSQAPATRFQRCQGGSRLSAARERDPYFRLAHWLTLPCATALCPLLPRCGGSGAGRSTLGPGRLASGSTPALGSSPRPVRRTLLWCAARESPTLPAAFGSEDPSPFPQSPLHQLRRDCSWYREGGR